MRTLSITLLMLAGIAGGAGNAEAKRRRRVVVVETTISILPPIAFVPRTARFTIGSTEMLDGIAATLLGNPSITLVEVRAGSDSARDPHRLGDARARAVVAALVARGVPARRLVAGTGLLHPYDGPGASLIILTRDSTR